MARNAKSSDTPRRISKGWIIALCILVALALCMGAAALTVLHSMKAMKTNQAPDLSGMAARAAAQQAQKPQEEKLEETPEAETPEKEEPEEPPALELIDSYTVRRNGQLYRYNDEVVTLMLLGIDQDAPTGAEGGRINAYADVIVLAALDLKNKDLSFYTISRDTMCEFATFDDAGQSTGYGFGQLALAYSFGTDEAQSCEITKNAVSQLLSDLNIYSCSALYLDGLGVINDAAGGVTLKPIETLPYSHNAICEGVEVTLDGNLAEQYIRWRDETETGNLKRMERQKQYCIALAKKALQSVRENPMSALDLYESVRETTVTDLTTGDIAYLATQAAELDFNGQIRSVPGIIQVSEDHHVEYYLDETALMDLILDLYYEPIAS